MSWLLVAVLVILFVVSLVMLPYAIARFFLHPHTSEETEALSGSIVFRMGLLHGLILALIFSQELTDLVDVRNTSAKEAAAAADIFYDLDRYDPVASRSLRHSLAEYVHTVIHEEWGMLSQGQLSQRAWDLWEEVYMGVLDLAPESLRHESLRARMLQDIETISESRYVRGADSNSGVSGLFWFIAVLGTVFIVLPYFVFSARKVNLLLLLTFAVYNALVVYTIFAMSNPYSPPGATTPSAFVEVFSDDMEHLLINTQDTSELGE